MRLKKFSELEEKGVKVNGAFLLTLMFADDVLIEELAKQLSNMLPGSNEKAPSAGFKINKDKTLLMTYYKFVEELYHGEST